MKKVPVELHVLRIINIIDYIYECIYVIMYVVKNPKEVKNYYFCTCVEKVFVKLRATFYTLKIHKCT